MAVYSPATTNNFPQKLIGEILQEAGLISSPQLNTALKHQIKSSNFRLGEIIVAKGWLQQKTIDFLVDVFSVSNLHKYLPKQPIGYYLKEAGLLTPQQIDTIVEEQQTVKIKFCYLAVLKGFLRPKTADFFLDHVVTRFSTTSTATNQVDNQLSEADTIVLTENINNDISRNKHGLSLIDYDDLCSLYDRDIISSPVYIDLKVSI